MTINTLKFLDSMSAGTIIQTMDVIPTHHRSLSEWMTIIWQRGVRLATRLAISFGLSTATAIGLGAAVTDNAFVQIVVTVLAALGFWLPFVFVVIRVERWLNRQRSPCFEPAGVDRRSSDEAEESWRRLFAMAPGDSARLTVLRRSLDESRLSPGKRRS